MRYLTTISRTKYFYLLSMSQTLKKGLSHRQWGVQVFNICPLNWEQQHSTYLFQHRKHPKTVLCIDKEKPSFRHTKTFLKIIFVQHRKKHKNFLLYRQWEVQVSDIYLLLTLRTKIIKLSFSENRKQAEAVFHTRWEVQVFDICQLNR